MLDRMNRHDLPLSVKKALNEAAISLKLNKKLINKEFSDNFTIRKKSFINSHSGFEKVKFSEWNINKMESKAGITKGKSRAGDNLRLQEEGGNLGLRYVPTKHTRIGASNLKKQSSKHFYSKYKNKQKGVISKSKRLTIIKTRKSISMINKDGEWKPLYILVSSVRINRKPFISVAGKKAGKDINNYYIAEARRRISRLRF